MNTDPQVVEELRSMFKSGATPSRLIYYIAERHGGDGPHHSLIQAYFREAFGVPIVRGLNPIDRYEQFDLRYSFLNIQLLHEIIERRREWDANGTTDAATWLDNLTASGDAARFQELQSTPLSEMRESWHKLTPREQGFIVRSLSSARYLDELVQIMSRLLEALQQQVNDLQTPAGIPGA